MLPSEQVLTILEEIAEDDGLHQNLDTRLYEEHILDSLKTVELMIALGDAFGIDIAPTSFEPEQWATPRRIIAMIEGALRSRAVAL